jgi:Alpha/beta hydrolase domain
VGREAFDLASVGYSQSEFFLEGTASSYAAAPGSTLTTDGSDILR